MYYVYILESIKYKNKYYTGSTSNIVKRINEHNAGRSRSTKPFKPWELVYHEEFPDRGEARKRENQIKRYKGGEAFRKLIMK